MVGNAPEKKIESILSVCPTPHSKLRRAVSYSFQASMLAIWFLFVAVSSSSDFIIDAATASEVWQAPGCHKVGHTRKISIPNCVEFHMTTNACRGYCESWAVPSLPKTTPSQPVTSIGQCCNIMETENVSARVLCVDGLRTLTFKSAVTCSCYHCKKD